MVEEAEEEAVEAGEGDPVKSLTAWLRVGAAIGREARDRGLGGRPQVKRRCRSRTRPAGEEQRVLGDLRCSRSERRQPGCWAAAQHASDCESDSGAGGLTLESPGLDTSVWGSSKKESKAEGLSAVYATLHT